MGAFRGDRLQKLRRKRGYASQEQLAEALTRRRNLHLQGDTDAPVISQQLVSWWETGNVEPGVENVLVIAQLLEASLDFLYGLTNEPDEYLVPTSPTDDMWNRLERAARQQDISEILQLLAAVTKRGENASVPR